LLQRWFRVGHSRFGVGYSHSRFRVTAINKVENQMKNLLITSCLAVVVACSAPEEKIVEKQAELSQQELIRRGKYLTTVGACHDCHSPKIFTPAGMDIDTTRMFSGHPMNDEIPPIVATKDWTLFGPDLTSFVGPWGVSFAANLTPDDTGIGNWTLDQFKTALRKGKYKGLEAGRDLLPPMPWIMYKNYTDEDIKAVFTYLKSIKPVHNVVPAPIGPEQLQAKLTKLN
jgi:hypothetical protein